MSEYYYNTNIITISSLCVVALCGIYFYLNKSKPIENPSDDKSKDNYSDNSVPVVFLNNFIDDGFLNKILNLLSCHPILSIVSLALVVLTICSPFFYFFKLKFPYKLENLEIKKYLDIYYKIKILFSSK